MAAAQGNKSREKQSADGIRWLLGAGFLAALLSYCLFSADEFLSTSRERDRQHADMLRELRVAQASMKSGDVDPRLQVRILTSREASASTAAVNKAPNTHQAHH